MFQFLKSLFGSTDTNNAHIRLNAADFKQGIANKNIILVDVRTPGEYQTGKIANAKLINVMAPDFKSKLNQLKKDQPLYLYCKGGVRSKRAAKQAVKLGFTEVYDLKGGIIAFH